MIHSELPNTNPATYKTTLKKYVSVITPEKIVGNEKLLLTLMFTGMAAVLITWGFRKG